MYIILDESLIALKVDHRNPVEEISTIQIIPPPHLSKTNLPNPYRYRAREGTEAELEVCYLKKTRFYFPESNDFIFIFFVYYYFFSCGNRRNVLDGAKEGVWEESRQDGKEDRSEEMEEVEAYAGRQMWRLCFSLQRLPSLLLPPPPWMIKHNGSKLNTKTRKTRRSVEKDNFY